MIPELRRLFDERSIRFEQVERIVVDAGPGSFTGLRVGIATANALGLAWKVPVVGVSSLDLIAWRYRAVRPGAGTFRVGVFAGRGRVYGARYRALSRGFEKLSEDRLLSREAFLKEGDDPDTVGWRLDRIDLEGTALGPDAGSALEMERNGFVSEQAARFASPHYVRDCDARPS
jgi:tRNA threonylcarbamoyl adenosine modification protein YeaZ